MKQLWPPCPTIFTPVCPWRRVRCRQDIQTISRWRSNINNTCSHPVYFTGKRVLQCRASNQALCHSSPENFSYLIYMILHSCQIFLNKVTKSTFLLSESCIIKLFIQILSPLPLVQELVYDKITGDPIFLIRMLESKPLEENHVFQDIVFLVLFNIGVFLKGVHHIQSY